jgi:hypothetical protein
MAYTIYEKNFDKHKSNDEEDDELDDSKDESNIKKLDYKEGFKNFVKDQLKIDWPEFVKSYMDIYKKAHNSDILNEQKNKL